MRSRLITTALLMLIPVQSFALDPPEFITQFGVGILSPLIGGLGVDSGGNVYVADAGNDRVVKFDNDGHFLGAFGSHGSNASEFNGASDVAAAPDGSIYVADYFNGRVQVFDASFGFMRQWQTPAGSFIAISPSGEYIFTRVQGYTYVYRPDSTLVAAWTPLPTLQGQGFGVGPSGHVYVGFQGQVIVFNTLGVEVTRWPVAGPFGPAYPVTVDSDEHVYVATPAGNVQIYDATGKLLTSFGSSGSGPGQFPSEPRPDIAVDAHHSVFVEDGSSRIQKFGYRTTPTKPTTWGQLKLRYR